MQETPLELIFKPRGHRFLKVDNHTSGRHLTPPILSHFRLETNMCSPQEEFANNLSPIQYGLAVYRPFASLESSGRVGDVGFFTNYGEYKSIGNAFDTKVPSRPDPLVTDQGMEGRKWPCLSGLEYQMVKETSFPAFQIAVGKLVQKKKWEEIADPQEFHLHEFLLIVE